MRQKLLQSSQAKEGDIDSSSHVRDIRDPSAQISTAPLNPLSEATQTLSPVEEEYLKTIKQLGKTAKTEAEKQDDSSDPS